MSAPKYLITDTETQLADVFQPSQGNPICRPEWWRKHGLENVVANHGGRISASRIGGNGLDGAAGIWVTVWGPDATRPDIGVFLDREEWRKVRRETVDQPAVFVGWKKEDPPQPWDIANDNPFSVAGPELKLNDGFPWMIPQIREPMSSQGVLPIDAHIPNLPRLIQRDLDGEISRPVKDGHRELWERSASWFERWWNIACGNESTFSATDALSFAVDVLALRYAFPEYLNDACGIIDTVQLESIVGTAIGWPAVEEVLISLQNQEQKKSSQDEPTPQSLNSGEMD